MLGIAAQVARAWFASCLLYVVANAVADALADGRWLLAVGEVAAFPLTLLLYPPLVPNDGSAWPFGSRIALVVALGLGLLAYAVLFALDRRQTPPGEW
jgi:hypothetical protein